MPEKRSLILALVLCFAGPTHGFDQETIEYVHPSDRYHSVRVLFDGKVFEPPLEILKKDAIAQNAEFRRFQEFFKKLYEQNKKGDRDAILGIWHPDDHAAVRAMMDDASLEQNKNIFNAITAIRLKVVVQYGAYYITLVEMHLPGQDPMVMKYAVGEYRGELRLSNGLNRDYFYELISHYLDDTNFGRLLQQGGP